MYRTLMNLSLWIVKPTKQCSIICHDISTLMNNSLLIRRPTKQNCVFSHQLVEMDPSNTIVNSICESLRKGLNWDMLSRNYDSTKLSDYVVERVILELKEPNEAKKALSFFHWVAYSKNASPGVKVYCMVVHILARARLAYDARGLLESVLMKHEKNGDDESKRFLVVMLLDTYKITESCPFVFDLLVQCYSKLRMLETAFDVICYLDEQGVSLRLGTYNNLLYVFQKSANENPLIWRVYGHMIKKRIYPNKTTERIMIDALCKGGELQKYVDIIDRIHGKRCAPIVIASTSLLYRMLSEGQVDESLLMLKRMLLKDLIPDTISYSMIIYAKLKSGGLDSARETYEEMLSRGFCPNSFVYTLFIGAYCKDEMIDGALRLMEELVNIGLKPFDETYNLLITGCAKTGKLTNSVNLCEEMMNKGFIPSSSAFNEVVSRLCEGGGMWKANEMLTILLEKGFLPDETTYYLLIDCCRREKNISEVLKLYYEMESRSMCPGLLVFSSLIRTLCEHGKLEEAEKYLAVLKSRLLCPSVGIYETLVISHLEKGNIGRAHELCDEMLRNGLEVDQWIINKLSPET